MSSRAGRICAEPGRKPPPNRPVCKSSYRRRVDRPGSARGKARSPCAPGESRLDAAGPPAASPRSAPRGFDLPRGASVGGLRGQQLLLGPQPVLGGIARLALLPEQVGANGDVGRLRRRCDASAAAAASSRPPSASVLPWPRRAPSRHPSCGHAVPAASAPPSVPPCCAREDGGDPRRRGPTAPPTSVPGRPVVLDTAGTETSRPEAARFTTGSMPGALRGNGARRLVRDDLALHPLEGVVDRLRVAVELERHRVVRLAVEVEPERVRLE